MRLAIRICVVMLALSSSALADDRIRVCSQAAVTMPSLKEHVAWLEANPRYGHDTAQSFYDGAKSAGEDYLQFQVYFLPEYPGGSGWFDINGMTGISNANASVLHKWSCGKGSEAYPLLLMIGIEPKSIMNGTLFVAARKGTYTLISLKSFRDVQGPLPMRMAKSGSIVCPGLRAAEFDSEERKCSDLVSFFK